MQLKRVFKHLFHPHHGNQHRPRLLHPESLMSLLALAVIFFVGLKFFEVWFAPGRGILGFASSITASQVIQETNQKRAEQGLSPLTANDRLNQAAVAKAQDMFQKQYWAHVSPEGLQPWNFISNAGYSYRVAGENLARDFGNTGDMINAWMASETHRANIVNSKYQEIGIAVVDGELLGYETTLVVQMFGTAATPIAQVPEKPAPSVEVAVSEPEQPEPLTLAQSEPEVVPPQVEIVPAAPVVIEPVILASSRQQLSLDRSPLFSPLQLTKAFFLGMIMLIVFTLVYDTAVIGHYATMRTVGKNAAHILLLLSVAFLVIFFKGGIIG